MRREREAPVVCWTSFRLLLLLVLLLLSLPVSSCAPHRKRVVRQRRQLATLQAAGSETQLTCLTAVKESFKLLLLLSPWRASLSLSRSVPLSFSCSLSVSVSKPALFVADHPQRLFAAGVAVAALLSRSGCSVKCRLNWSFPFTSAAGASLALSFSISLSHTLSFCLSLFFCTWLHICCCLKIIIIWIQFKGIPASEKQKQQSRSQRRSRRRSRWLVDEKRRQRIVKCASNGIRQCKWESASSSLSAALSRCVLL